MAFTNDNNLDFVRFFLASMVFVSHAHDLSGSHELSILSTAISSTLAVQAFFVISGFLIFQSYDRSSTLRSYTLKRARRILPAYVIVVLASAGFLGLTSTLQYYSYIANPGVLKYISANLLFLNFLAPELPGVFDDNVVHAVNGALWTLKIEVAFYAAVPICVWLFHRIGRTPVLITIYLMSAIYAAAMSWFAEARQSDVFVELARQLPGQMTYFVAGAAIYYHFNRFRERPMAMLLCGLLLFAASSLAFNSLLRPLGVALIVMSVAFGPYLGGFGRYGDFSYGIYIIHFPILQTLVAIGLPNYSLPLFLLVSGALVLLLAVAMWHLVEKRFLRRDSHYRRAADALASPELSLRSAG